IGRLDHPVALARQGGPRPRPRRPVPVHDEDPARGGGGVGGVRVHAFAASARGGADLSVVDCLPMPPARRPAPGVPALLGLAAAAAAATAALYGLAVRTEAGQRLDDAALGDLGGAGWARARQATNDLLDTISVSSLTLIGAAIMAIALA